MDSIARIASFSIDHDKLLPGLYVSRVDGDITTYDMRCRRPNTGDLLDNSTLHSLEHMFATYIRNGELRSQIVYFGPMGCQTGFYLLVRNADPERTVKALKTALAQVVAHTGEVFGNSQVECGNFRTLSLKASQDECASYLKVLEDWTVDKLAYPKGDTK